MSLEEEIEYDSIEEVSNVSWSVSKHLMMLVEMYGMWFLQQAVSFCYAIYLRFTVFSAVIFCVRYIPTGLYTYKLMKNIILASRGRLKEKQMELEDIQLQIEIVNAKLCVHEEDFNERADLLRREEERLKRVRARVRDVIAGDESLRRILQAATDCDWGLDATPTPQEDNEIINDLLKTLMRDQYAALQQNLEKMEGEESETSRGEHSNLCPSLSDLDMRQDCRVRIVKVTNVYKVAYLKHYIKQQKLRRATKRAALKKKMESIKKLLDDWQKTLNMVINSKLTILNIDTHPIDVASQDAMGDYSKPRDSDTDSENRNEMFYDEFSLSWTQNPYRPYGYNYEEIPETAVSANYYEQDNGDVKYSAHFQCEGLNNCPKMMSIIEETGSQLAIEEVSCEDVADCRDLVAI